MITTMGIFFRVSSIKREINLMKIPPTPPEVVRKDEYILIVFGVWGVPESLEV